MAVSSRILSQTPVTMTLTLTIERNGARTEHLEAYLRREITRLMNRAQFATPAGSKLLGFTIESQERIVSVRETADDFPTAS